jgi:hypothetical protein
MGRDCNDICADTMLYRPSFQRLQVSVSGSYPIWCPSGRNETGAEDAVDHTHGHSGLCIAHTLSTRNRAREVQISQHSWQGVRVEFDIEFGVSEVLSLLSPPGFTIFEQVK